MNPSENASSHVYTGHVKNGAVILDAPLTFADGHAVRVEPLAQARLEAERIDCVRQLQQLFAAWTEEDGRLTDEEADRLRIALDQSAGLGFQSPALD